MGWDGGKGLHADTGTWWAVGVVAHAQSLLPKSWTRVGCTSVPSPLPKCGLGHPGCTPASIFPHPGCISGSVTCLPPSTSGLPALLSCPESPCSPCLAPPAAWRHFKSRDRASRDSPQWGNRQSSTSHHAPAGHLPAGSPRCSPARATTMVAAGSSGSVPARHRWGGEENMSQRGGQPARPCHGDAPLQAMFLQVAPRMMQQRPCQSQSPWGEDMAP